MIQKEPNLNVKLTYWNGDSPCGVLKFNFTCEMGQDDTEEKTTSKEGMVDVFEINDRLCFQYDYDWYSAERFDEEELEEVKKVIKNKGRGIKLINSIEYISCEQVKEYFKEHPDIAKEKYVKYYGTFFDDLEDAISEDNTISAFLTYGIDKLLYFISNDGVYEDKRTLIYIRQEYTEEQLDLMKQALKIIIGLLDEAEKDKIRERVEEINKFLYTDHWGLDCWKKTIDLNEIGLGEK